jgi:ATP-dependent Lhr-like helicase
LEDLCERLKIPVTKWHGDASDSKKRRLRENPAGVLLITPESLEALFVRRPELLKPMFGSLKFVVIDELHAFLDSERGVQLSSLLKRLNQKTNNPPRRIGLSATIGDLSIAASWLRPADPTSVRIIESQASAAALQLQVRGVVEDKDVPEEASESDPNEADSALGLIADHIFRTLRSKGNHLVFAGSRKNTEALSDLLRRKCENAKIPNEYFPHHGNLSRDTRESLETRLKEGTLPTTAVATTTLELGIDIGSVESIAQLGAPSSISSLRQRLGRSGRREGKAAVMRIYAVEASVDQYSSVFDRLRAETIQAVAAVRLLLKRWVEPPRHSAFHFSTLLHQILSVIVERGGIAPEQAYKLLAGKGPFESVTPDIFARLLRSMHDRESKLIEQASDGTLMLGQLGEKITSHYDFYSVFVTYDESTIVTESKTLGTLSVTNALGPGDYLIFAGQRWRVKQVDDLAKRILVEPSPAGRVPKFKGEAAPLSDKLAEEMRAVYLSTDIPEYLDKAAKTHLAEGRAEFMSLGLDQRFCISSDGRMYIFPWSGTQKLDTLRLALRYCGLQVDQGRIALSTPIPDGPEPVFEIIRQLSRTAPPGEALALMSETLRSAKYDNLLPDDLLRLAFANDKLDLDLLVDICVRLTEGATRLGSPAM